MNKKLLFTLLALMILVFSCDKEEENDVVKNDDFLSYEDAQYLEELDDFSNFNVDSVILPNGELLANFLTEYDSIETSAKSKGSAYMQYYYHNMIYAKTLQRAHSLTKRSLYVKPNEGENKPAQSNGLAYGYGNKDHTKRRIPSKPSSGDACEHSIYGLDCSGFVYQSFLNAGVDLHENGAITANVMRKPETVAKAINNAYPVFNDYYIVKSAGSTQYQNISLDIRSGDIIYWCFKGSTNAFHIGIVAKMSDGRLAVLQSNGYAGDCYAGSCNKCVQNLSTKCGPRILEITDNGWFNNKDRYWGLTRMIGSTAVLRTKNFSVLGKSKAGEITTGGEILEQGASSVTTRGVCWSTQQFPTIEDNKTTDGSGTGTFNSTISGLLPNTTYYIRSYATNSSGTSYGNQIEYKGNSIIYGNGVTDVDGNYYKSVIIGEQEWLAENLKTTKYNDRTAIPLVTDNTTWSNLTTPAYCWYNNDIINKNLYGALYNWYTVYTGKLCPTGWHVPNITELSILVNNTGGYDFAGGKLKSTRTDPVAHPRWESPNAEATDVYEFSALPGGYRNSFGNYYSLGEYCHIWSSSVSNMNDILGKNILMTNEQGRVGEYGLKKATGLSIRCVKD